MNENNNSKQHSVVWENRICVIKMDDTNKPLTFLLDTWLVVYISRQKAYTSLITRKIRVRSEYISIPYEKLAYFRQDI